MVFGIVLNRNGWRIDYLGMSTPVEELTRTVDARHPDLVVLAATLPENLEPPAEQLAALAQRAPLVLAGAGATPELAAVVGAGLLTRRPGYRGAECGVAAVKARPAGRSCPPPAPLACGVTVRCGPSGRRTGPSNSQGQPS